MRSLCILLAACLTAEALTIHSNAIRQSTAIHARQPIIAGNWKLNTDLNTAIQLAADIKESTSAVNGVEVVVIPPFPFLRDVLENVGDNVKVGAQSCWYEDKGAFTGAISPAQIKSLGCKYVLVGHSERRKFFKETDADFNKMIKKLFQTGLIPILCVGELKEEFELGVCRQVCTMQLAKCLKGVSPEDVKKIIIAYEPVWAIGTGLTATPQVAQNVHQELRAYLRKTYGNDVAKEVRIQYGGSVTPDTVDDLMSQPDIDGALVGGASLSAASFEKLVKFKKPSAGPKKSLMSLYNTFGKSTKFVVSFIASLSLLLSKTWLAGYFVIGGILNAMFSKVLKAIIKEPRPSTSSSIEYGMPSSHAQSLFYFATVVTTAHIKSSTRLCALVSVYTLLTASWRVHSGLHTISQTVVGAVVGTAFGYLASRIAPCVATVLKVGSVDSPLRFFSSKLYSLAVIIGGASILYGKEIKKLMDDRKI